MTTKLSLTEKVGEREKYWVCTALFCFFFLKPKSPKLPFPHTPEEDEQEDEQDTNINIGDHFLLVCLYLCSKGEIYLSQALTKAWFQVLMKHCSFLHE